MEWKYYHRSKFILGITDIGEDKHSVGTLTHSHTMKSHCHYESDVKKGL